MAQFISEVAAIRAELEAIRKQFELTHETWEIRKEVDDIASKIATLNEAPATPSPTTTTTSSTRSLSVEEAIVEETIARIASNDPSYSEVKIVSFPEATSQTGVRIAAALLDNTNVTSVTLVNSKVSDEGARKFAEVIAKNRTLTHLNLETNMIGADGVSALAVALASNETLVELKISNQSKQAGRGAEQKLAEAFSTNKTLQKINCVIQDPTARGTIDRAITRNQELARQARRLK